MQDAIDPCFFQVCTFLPYKSYGFNNIHHNPLETILEYPIDHFEGAAHLSPASLFASMCPYFTSTNITRIIIPLYEINRIMVSDL